MAEPFTSEIRIMSFGYAPRGWAMCNGQLLPINQNQALFSLLGTTFGGNGQTTFALPDLRGQTPIHVGNGHVLGEKGGEQAHTVTISEMPLHTHVWNANNAATTPTNSPTASLVLSNSTGDQPWGPASNLTAMSPLTIQNTGGSQAHLNMQPFLVLTFCIALTGIFPSPN
jgi:microcystin-dependent protein